MQQLRPGGEFAPQHADAAAGKGLLETLPRFQDAKIAEALEADAQFPVARDAVDRRAEEGLLTAAAFNDAKIGQLRAQRVAANTEQRRGLALIIVTVGHRAAYQRPGDPFPQRLARQGKLTTNKIVELIIARRRGLIVQRRQPQLGGADLLFFTQQYALCRVFSSSRILPGQGYSISLASVSGARHEPGGPGGGRRARENGPPVREYPGDAGAAAAAGRGRYSGDSRGFAETTLADGLHQVHVGGGDHPHVHLNGLARADAGDFALLQNAQQFDLKRQAKLADFIEQQGAALRRLEPAGMALYRAGKRPFFMAEQLRFRQAFAERAAVDGQKRPVAARAMVMQVAGDDLLTGAGFADNPARSPRWGPVYPAGSETLLTPGRSARA
ncbi:Uncharacterized protein conserved in bacteria [Klebsiella michiganensis]|nr:Uncharacterized protein conserved in bacteria [Klebsiella michiganensis]